MSNYYGYVRVSTETQVTDGFGIDTQIAQIRQFTTENNIKIENIFIDRGCSGTTIDRPQLLDMFNALQPGDKVIVANTSRLWRDDTVKVLIRRELQKSKVDVISIEQRNYSLAATEPADFLMNSIMEILDVYDRMIVCKKLAAGRKTKASKGDKACGACPYGYIWDNKKVAIDYNNHLIVRDIFKQFVNLKSYAKVAQYCDKVGYRTKSGKSFSRQQISSMLHNDFYIGVVTHKGIKSQGNHEPIIDMDTWNAVQSML